MTIYKPTDADLKRLKNPLGQLLRGGPSETIPQLRGMISEKRPTFITAVGDVVSQETAAAGVLVNLRIVDQKTMRQALPPSTFKAENTYKVRNPAGVITSQAWDMIKRAFAQNESVIFVEGEEDLLALPCVLESPNGALVLYGQPNEGMVVVKVEKRVRREVARILERASRENA